MKPPVPIVIVRPKRRHTHAPHGGAWKVAYADFVTAMMAFFMVMWIIGQSQAMRKGVAGYFRQPGVLEHQRSDGILPGATTGIDPVAPRSLRAAGSADADDDALIREAMERSARRLREALSGLPEMEMLKGQIEIRVTSEGLRIELVESAKATFFDTGSATLKPETERLLGVIARELGTLKRPVVIEGHTDSAPYADIDGYTNWELSADRANAARRQMHRSGLPDGLVRDVRGYADRDLAYPELPREARNRRVSIIVLSRGADR